MDNKINHKSCLVVLHGLGTNSRWMERYRNSFSRDYALIIPDLPYSPDSGLDCGKSVEDYSDKLFGSLKNVVRDEIILIGESLGGAVAMVLSQKLSCRKLVLVTPSLGLEGSFLPTFMKVLFTPVSVLANSVSGKIVKYDPDLGDLSRKIMASMPKHKMLDAIVALKRFNAFDIKPGCLPRLLVIGGKHDRVVPEGKLRLFANKHCADLYIDNESGHHVAVKRWPDVETRIREFLVL